MESTSTSLNVDQYPLGMRVMVVDDDNISLNVLKMCLLRCGYHGGVKALSLLRERRSAYDLVMLDVHMPEMNGLQVLQAISLEMDIPVMMVSSDSSQEIVKEVLDHGACDYLVKPFTVNQVRNVWQHVVRCQNAATKINKRRKRDGGADDDSDNNCGDDNSKKKKKKKKKKERRMKWSSELHGKFLEAVNKLGIDKAVPKKILELMDVPGLLKEQVASHLQKFRECLKKAAGVTRPKSIPEGVWSKLTAHALGCAEAQKTLAMPTAQGSSVSLQASEASFLQVMGNTAATIAQPHPQPPPQSSSSVSYNYQETRIMNHASTLVSQRNQPVGVELLPCANSQMMQHGHAHSDFGCINIMHFGSSLSMPQLLMSHSYQGTKVHPLAAAAQGQVRGGAKEVGAFLEYNNGEEEEEGILQEDFLVRYFNISDEDAFL